MVASIVAISVRGASSSSPVLRSHLIWCWNGIKFHSLFTTRMDHLYNSLMSFIGISITYFCDLLWQIPPQAPFHRTLFCLSGREHHLHLENLQTWVRLRILIGCFTMEVKLDTTVQNLTLQLRRNKKALFLNENINGFSNNVVKAHWKQTCGYQYFRLLMLSPVTVTSV